MEQVMTRMNRRSGWSDYENRLLRETADEAQQQGLPLKAVFERISEKTGRRPNSIRNYYYAQVRQREGEANHTARFTPFTQEEVDDCRRGLLSSMDALGDSLAALENWYYGQITRGEPLYPPEYGKVLTSAVSLDEVRQTLQSYSYSVCYAVTAEPGTQGKGGSEDVE